MIARPPATTPKPEAAPPLRPGANVLMGRNPLGFWVQGPAGSADFSHPFTVQASGTGARVGKGLVIANISAEPVIGTVPISGDDKHPQPLLTLDASLVDELGQSWVCVEVTPNKDGKLDAKPDKPQVVVVQSRYPVTLTSMKGRAPLALLFRKKGRWQVYQIAMFHLRYETTLSTAGERKHFFL